MLEASRLFDKSNLKKNQPVDIRDVSKSSKRKDNLLFGELLLSKRLLSRGELAEGLNEQRNRGGKLGEVLVRLQTLSDENLTSTLAEHLSTERVHLDVSEMDMKIARSVPEAIAKRFCLVAIGEEYGKIVVAMADPLDVVATDTVSMKLGREIKVVISSSREIRAAIEKVYHGSDIDEQRLRDLVEHAVDTELHRSHSRLCRPRVRIVFHRTLQRTGNSDFWRSLQRKQCRPVRDTPPFSTHRGSGPSNAVGRLPEKGIAARSFPPEVTIELVFGIGEDRGLWLSDGVQNPLIDFINESLALCPERQALRDEMMQLIAGLLRGFFAEELFMAMPYFQVADGQFVNEAPECLCHESRSFVSNSRQMPLG